MLNADTREWRVYCLGTGGYVGQGEGAQRFVEFKDHWIKVTGFIPETIEHLMASLSWSN